MIISKDQRPIPSCLSHHTSLVGLKGILSPIKEKGICFRAVSNRYKNDEEEIIIGEYMLNYVKEHIPFQSSLDTYRGYNESASISFMEGESTQHMIDEYGRFRLEFDLRNFLHIGLNEHGFIDCEYIDKEDLGKYSEDYTTMLKNYFERISQSNEKSNITTSSPSIDIVGVKMMLDILNDLKYKVFALKTRKWEEEKEWRIIVSLKETDSDTLWTESGKPYKEIYLPKEALTGITIFFDQSNGSVALSEYKEIENFLRERECDVPIYWHKLKI